MNAAAVCAALAGLDQTKVPDGEVKKASLYSTKHKPLLHTKRVVSPHPPPKSKFYSEQDVEQMLLNQSKIKSPPAPVRKMPAMYTEKQVQG